MLKIGLIAFLLTLPALACAEGNRNSYVKKLLIQITEFHAFRSPHLSQSPTLNEQKNVAATKEGEKPQTSTDTCYLQSKPYHKGAGVESVCNTTRGLKKELEAIAANH